MKDVWDFIERYYPNYSSSREIAKNEDLFKLLSRDFEPGDSAEKRLEFYNGIEDPRIQAEYDESCKFIYWTAIKGFINSQDHDSKRDS